MTQTATAPTTRYFGRCYTATCTYRTVRDMNQNEAGRECSNGRCPECRNLMKYRSLEPWRFPPVTGWVVVFAAGVYGPFPTRREAIGWGARWGQEQGLTGSFLVHKLHKPLSFSK